MTGEPGRLLVLTGTIEGPNFEPGICTPDRSGTCPGLTDSEPVPAGFFKPAHSAPTALTLCDPCTVDGIPGSLTLRISSPRSRNVRGMQFTIQDAAGGLQGLRGQGSMDLATGTYSLRYHFSG